MVPIGKEALSQTLREQAQACVLRRGDKPGAAAACFNRLPDCIGAVRSSVGDFNFTKMLQGYDVVVRSNAHRIECPHGILIRNIPCVCCAGTDRQFRRAAPQAKKSAIALIVRSSTNTSGSTSGRSGCCSRSADRISTCLIESTPSSPSRSMSSSNMSLG